MPWCRASNTTGVSVPTGQIQAERNNADFRSIYVQNANPTGTSEDSPFTLQLWCSPPAAEFLPLTAQAAPGPDSDQPAG